MTSFSQVLGSAKQDSHGWCFQLPEDWTQGRSAFGGLQVAMAVRAMRSLVTDVPLRTLQTTFLAPVSKGDVRVKVRVLRSGKSSTHVEARIEDEELQALVVGVFGASRASVVRVEPAPAPAGGAVDAGLQFPFIPGVMPNFLQHFDVRMQEGALPYSGTPAPQQRFSVSLRDEGPASEAHLVAIADFIPPLGLSYLETPAPGSTLTWMLDLLRDRYEDLPLSGWTIDGHLDSARDGYTVQSVNIWAPDGSPAAFSRQSMLVFG